MTGRLYAVNDFNTGISVHLSTHGATARITPPVYGSATTLIHPASPPHTTGTHHDH